MLSESYLETHIKAFAVTISQQPLGSSLTGRRTGSTDALLRERQEQGSTGWRQGCGWMFHHRLVAESLCTTSSGTLPTAIWSTLRRFMQTRSITRLPQEGTFC